MSVQDFIRGAALIALVSVGLGLAQPAMAQETQKGDGGTRTEFEGGGGGGGTPNINPIMAQTIDGILIDVMNETPDAQRAIVESIRQSVQNRKGISTAERDGILKYIDQKYNDMFQGMDNSNSSGGGNGGVPQQSHGAGNGGTTTPSIGADNGGGIQMTTTPAPEPRIAQGSVRMANGEVIIDGKVALSKDVKPTGATLDKVVQLLKGYINANYKQATLESQLNRLNLPQDVKAELLDYLDSKLTMIK
jgi:hypothetical protein